MTTPLHSLLTWLVWLFLPGSSQKAVKIRITFIFHNFVLVFQSFLHTLINFSYLSTFQGGKVFSVFSYAIIRLVLFFWNVTSLVYSYLCSIYGNVFYIWEIWLSVKLKLQNGIAFCEHMQILSFLITGWFVVHWEMEIQKECNSYSSTQLEMMLGMDSVSWSLIQGTFHWKMDNSWRSWPSSCWLLSKFGGQKQDRVYGKLLLPALLLI